jgi:EAL domain-containing protein (putative c-di-GMP-specific phosphodiesterase class I)
MYLSRDLHQAIENNQLFLVCQPIINLQSGFTYKTEALLRWNHPRYGLVDAK